MTLGVGSMRAQYKSTTIPAWNGLRVTRGELEGRAAPVPLGYAPAPVATSSAPRRRPHVFAVLLAVAALLGAGGALHVQGLLPARVPSPATPFSYHDYEKVLRHVRPDGDVDFASVGRERKTLDGFVDSLASFSPHNRPDVFPTPEDALAYWLNAYNALVLQQVVDGYPYLETVQQPLLGRFFWGRSWALGGERLTLWALHNRVLRREFADPRIHLALFQAARGGPRLDGSHFQPEFLDSQLNEAGRRFVGDRRNVRLERDTVYLTSLFEEYREDFLAALPEGRGGNVLQFVWAFLPDTCEERPGCDTRSDLDRACGPRLDQCRIAFMERDWTLPDAAARP
ncbi:hypothetical protein MXAN_6490 [Myxococcus xanthus DK 1622]|uniref:DUF547 domain-containing protein n=1 Tax=Myxococcus xanthus (strain DK1622) TaxID=246197 RepID=Q1CYB1_MYXXD|nr:DUF547 domain-containing protein [Myxococcus xanthus]ABF88756.1 hypothetical protein MXAN_6490 [Myxococcus xanthus DK 1622]NOJ56937.1 DUF547 domain-containing protein [Myxococcus xanthus]